MRLLAGTPTDASPKPTNAVASTARDPVWSSCQSCGRCRDRLSPARIVFQCEDFDDGDLRPVGLSAVVPAAER